MFEVPDTVAVLGMWDANLGDYGGPCNTQSTGGGRAGGGVLRSRLYVAVDIPDDGASGRVSLSHHSGSKVPQDR